MSNYIQVSGTCVIQYTVGQVIFLKFICYAENKNDRFMAINSNFNLIMLYMKLNRPKCLRCSEIVLNLKLCNVVHSCNLKSYFFICV